MSRLQSSPGQAGGTDQLKQAGLRLPDVIAQSVGFIGPVFSSALVLPLVVGAGLFGAGVATPVAIILAAIGMAAIGWIIAEYAKRIHAAGALYDYVSDGFGDRAGFVGGWLYYAATMLLTTAIVVVIGGITSDFLKSTWNIGIPYWVLDLVYLVLLLAVIYVGIQISVRVQLVLVTISAIVVGAFFIYIVIKGGTSGNSVRPFQPSASADGWKGIFFGIIYAILVFTGFETAANLGEETRDPGKSIPRAIILSVVVVGAFYLLAAYAQDIGFGLNAKTWASSPAPLFQLAAPGAFGSSWFLDLVQILVILDIAAVGLGCAVCTVRGVFAMARDGRIPAGLRHPGRGCRAGRRRVAGLRGRRPPGQRRVRAAPPAAVFRAVRLDVRPWRHGAGRGLRRGDPGRHPRAAGTRPSGAAGRRGDHRHRRRRRGGVRQHRRRHLPERAVDLVHPRLDRDRSGDRGRQARPGHVRGRGQQAARPGPGQPGGRASCCVRTVAAMSGRHTLAETERAVSGRLGGLQLDFAAMAAVQNLHRTASAIRNRFEQTVLQEAGLSWTGFVVLWVTWIWDSLETRDAAQEAGISKGTLTGVVKTLESKGLVARSSLPADGRLVLLQITAAGERLMLGLFPRVNATEVETVSPLEADEVDNLAAVLRRILTHLERSSEP